MNLIKPSLSLLPMDDIAAELKSNKVNRNFMTREDNATDVDSVAGIKSNRIAISAEGHNRETVKNALNLDGKPASEYVSREDGNKFLKVSSELSKVYSEEIRNLRNELYLLYGELTKKGFIDNTMNFEGFVEGFDRGNILYEDYICGIASGVVGNTRDLYISNVAMLHYFEPGKKFVIKRSDTEEETVVTVREVNKAGKVNFEPSVNYLDNMDKIGLFKTTGEYINNTFSFSEIKKAVSEQTERYYTQSDDTDTKYLVINQPYTGYAVTFKVPRGINSSEGISGALSKFAIRAQAVGNPGGIRCHVLDIDAVDSNGQLDPKFDNITDAINKGYVLATSEIIHSTKDNLTKENDIYFDFYGGVHHNYKNGVKEEGKVDGETSFLSNNTSNMESVETFETADGYPILKDNRYCFIIESLGANSENYWRVRFSYYNNNNHVDDLHRRNASYVYKSIDTSGLYGDEKCLQIIDDITKYDIMYTLVVRDIIEEEEVGKQHGLYTARIVLPRPIEVSRARLTMRINREGMYNIKDHNSDYTIFTLERNTPTSHTTSNTGFVIGDKIIIGNTIATVKRVSVSEIQVENPVYLDERIVKFYTSSVYDAKVNGYVKKTAIPVYKINYVPTIKAKYVDWDNYNEILGTYESKDLTELPLDLELMTIIPDKLKSNERVSDRLLFEATFGEDEEGNKLIANEFELQIEWQSPFTERDINEFKDTADRNFKELIGRIHDLNLTFDRHY